MERGYWIKSKPVYDSLVWKEKATSHLVVAQHQGGMSVLKLFQQMYPKQPVTVLYEQGPDADADYSNTLKKVVLDDLQLFHTEQDVLNTLKKYSASKKNGFANLCGWF